MQTLIDQMTAALAQLFDPAQSASAPAHPRGHRMTPPAPTFDELRAAPHVCHCGRTITGRCWATQAAACPFERRPPPRWGVRWAQPETEDCE